MASRVVVGFDGSEEARRTVAWAVQEAGIRNAPLRVVAALQGAPPLKLWGPLPLLGSRRRSWPPPGRARNQR